MPNMGGFSWKRALGVTRAKQRISRKIGIPLTKSGRQRKLGKALTGGGCLLPAVLPVLIALGFFIFAIPNVTAQSFYTINLPILMKPEPAPTPVPLPGENLQCNTVGAAQICTTISDATPGMRDFLPVTGDY